LSAQGLQFAPGTFVVLDRGYVDYDLFDRWTDGEVWFVTRMKVGTLYEVRERREVPKRSGILADEIIELTGPKARSHVHCLRRVVYHDRETDKTLVFLTNHLSLGATTIARIYKDRWQVELFFKALKQNLRIKTFVGTSANAVRIQIWTALIAILLVKYLQFRSRLAWSLSNLVALLRWNLFTYRELWTWIDDPFDTPPLEPGLEQLEFQGTGFGQQTVAT
jgi:IS4 transposase